MPYQPLYKPNQLIYGEPNSPTVIITGWTVKTFVAEQVSKDTYAAMGQLYNATRGINFLVRNLLANPQIRRLITLGCTREDINAGAVKCLLDFFEYGVTEGVSEEGRQCWVIKSDIPGYIDFDIPLCDIEVLRVNTKVWVADSPAHVAEIANYIVTRLGPPEPTKVTPKVYPMTLPRSDTKPANLYGHRIVGDTIAECWIKVLHRIRLNGSLRATGYDGEVQELIDLVTVVQYPSLDFPEPNYLPFDKEYLLDGYLDSVVNDSETRPGVKYTYGQRMRSWFGRDQIKDVVAKLRKEWDSASAVINLWDSTTDNIKEGSPCLNHIWFRIIDKHMSMTATFRSNDMFSAWGANAMALAHLQQLVMAAVSPELVKGPLVTISQSAHIYDHSFGSADHIIRTYYKPTKPDYNDSVGYFIVDRTNEGVGVTQMHPNGEVVDTYTGRTPLPLLRRIMANNPTMQMDHAAYLGLEIGRAFELGDRYVQDKG